MKKITDFTAIKNSEYNELRADINAALLPLAKKYGVAFKAQKISVAPGFANLTLNMSITTDGELETKEAMYFREYAQLCGLDKADLFKSFNLSSTIYKIVGMKSVKGEERVLVKGPDSKLYLMPVSQVLTAMGRTVPESLNFQKEYRP